MKIKTKLTVIISGMTTLIIAVLSIVLLSRARALQIKMTIRDLEGSTGVYAKSLEAYYETSMNTAVFLAQIMGNFENVEAARRRQRFLENLEDIFIQNADLAGIYAVWQPGVIDGLDTQYRNAPGSGGKIIRKFCRIYPVMTILATRQPQPRTAGSCLPCISARRLKTAPV